MLYVGQTVFSSSLEIPAVYLGRRYVRVGKDYEFKYCVFLDNEYENDWEFHDLVPLITSQGNVFRGDYATGMFSGHKTDEFIDENKDGFKSHIAEVAESMKKNKINILNLNEDD